MKITSIISNWQKLDGGAMFGHVPRALWSRWYEVDELSRIRLACRCFLIELNNSKYLLETGIGSYMSPKERSMYGVESDRHLILEALDNLGIKADEIDGVILSHMHFDHAGGLLPSFENLEENGLSLVFPKAKFYVGREAFERAQNPHLRDRASFIDGLQEVLINSGRLILLDENSSEKPFEDCEFIFTNGHTIGQMHCLISHKKEKFFFAGDLIPAKEWLHLPVAMGYDRCAETLVDEKKLILGRAISEAWKILYTHDLNTALSEVRKNERGKYEAINEEKDFIRKKI